MKRKEITKAYKKCIKLLYKERKTIPYKSLDKCLYIVERYLEWVED